MKEKLQLLYKRLTETVLGSEEASYLLVTSLLAHGHVLIQGAPGIGKTKIAQTLANAIHGTFSRIQFTPDLLPSDIVGYSMYHQGTGKFEFIQGPVFSNIVVADEINRTGPRIQSALLECMNEGQVSVDGTTYTLDVPFMVIATQNTLYSSGTFPLPEPQLDRFLFSITMALPDRETQTRILDLHANTAETGETTPMLTGAEITAMQQEVLKIPVKENVRNYIVLLCEAARSHQQLDGSLSARASIALMRASQACAFLSGHPAVYPDDVKRVAPAVLSHRLGARELERSGPVAVAGFIDELLKNTPVP